MELIIGIGVLVVLGGMLVGIYNRLVALRQNVNQGVADIDAQLRQRHDLIPNLVSTVQGYAAHEAGTLQSVIEARNAAASGAPNSANEAQLRVALEEILAATSEFELAGPVTVSRWPEIGALSVPLQFA